MKAKGKVPLQHLPSIFYFHVTLPFDIGGRNMIANLIWWAAIALEALILGRAASRHFLGKYPLFYLYLGCVFLIDLTRLCAYRLAPEFYPPLYWYTELATILASYAVVVEIFRQSVRHHPGIARLVRNFLSLIFILTVSYSSVHIIQAEFVSLPGASAEVGLYFRYVEGALFLGMLWLFVRYRIPLGRNLLGMILGNAFWVGVNILNLTLWSLPGKEFSVLLRQLVPASYLITLVVWCMTLWSPQADLVAPAETDLERDYQLLAAKTRTVVARTSDRVTRAIRP